eukprot:scaffold1963_cov120-Isochrysis_galbana.AAC.2
MAIKQGPWCTLASRSSASALLTARRHGRWRMPDSDNDKHLSAGAAAHTNSKWVHGPLPEHNYALNTHRKFGALAMAMALWALAASQLVC